MSLSLFLSRSEIIAHSLDSRQFSCRFLKMLHSLIISFKSNDRQSLSTLLLSKLFGRRSKLVCLELLILSFLQSSQSFLFFSSESFLQLPQPPKLFLTFSSFFFFTSFSFFLFSTSTFFFFSTSLFFFPSAPF